MTAREPALIADIGGSNARFALVAPGDRPGAPLRRRCDDFASLDLAIRDALDELGARPKAVAIAVAAPVLEDQVSLTNHPWSFSIAELRAALGAESVQVINDFAAVAHALPLLTPDDIETIGGGIAVHETPRIVVGAGTGLGTAGLISLEDERYQAIPGEGGHATLAAGGILPLRVRTSLDAVVPLSWEDVLCGPGLERLYRAFAPPEAPALRAAQITATAAAEPDSTAARTVSMFATLLGSYAGDIALVYGALGGVYVCGGVVLGLRDQFDRQAFRAGFERKGRYRDYMARIPTGLIRHSEPGLLGLSRLLAQTGGEIGSRAAIRRSGGPADRGSAPPPRPAP